MTAAPKSSAPSSTYRLQLRPGFGFADAAEVVDYLDRLGVGAVYASPVLDASPGSTHGYDVVDPTRARPELGGEEGRLALSARVAAAGLGFVLDIVPNHMSVESPETDPWWWDVLKHGQQSRYAGYFDIDWAAGPVLVPILGDEGEPTVEGDVVRYYDHRLPVSEHYRFVHWRRANEELNYRRFFDITTLAAVRVEDPEVFEATHGEVLRWVADGQVTGLRVDHPDGLADPGGYFRRLKERSGVWIVAEKILGVGEPLPTSWPVEGTTGYDALREICGVFVDPEAEEQFTALAA
jgi:(1->4)-alpha-D-glucan 1-alpha-D-glucosylmutase